MRLGEGGGQSISVEIFQSKMCHSNCNVKTWIRSVLLQYSEVRTVLFRNGIGYDEFPQPVEIKHTIYKALGKIYKGPCVFCLERTRRKLNLLMYRAP